MKNSEFNRTVYTVCIDAREYPYIVENNLVARIKESAEETTSPRGVEPKLFVREGDENWELCTWQHGGRWHVIESYSNEDDANEAWLQRTYENDYLDSCIESDDYDSKEEAINSIAESMGLSVACVESLLHHHEVYRTMESKLTARRIEARYFEAKKNAEGNMTKKLRQTIDRAKFPSCYMWGMNTPFSSPELDIEQYYSEEFRNELRSVK